MRRFATFHDRFEGLKGAGPIPPSISSSYATFRIPTEVEMRAKSYLLSSLALVTLPCVVLADSVSISSNNSTLKARAMIQSTTSRPPAIPCSC